MGEGEKPLAVIVKGNPKYVAGNPDAARFYDRLRSMLEERGYVVKSDPGRPHTVPDESAALWVGHSRGEDRLRFAPKGVKTIPLSRYAHPKDLAREHGVATGRYHYVVTPQMAKALKDAEFRLGVVMELTKAATGTPDEVLVEGEHSKLTKSQVYDWYMTPKVRRKILEQVSGRPVMLIQQHADPVVRRKTPEGKEIVIEEGAKGPDDPSDYMNWVGQHTVEFHPVHGEEVDHLYVDIDPKGNVPWEKTKEITKAVASALRREPDVKGARIVYSGGRGFYVKAPLIQPVKTDKARERLKKILQPLTENIPAVTLGVPGPSQIRLDVSTLHQAGSLRAEYSLNRKTGLVSIPVKSLDGFEKEDASLQKVLKGL